MGRPSRTGGLAPTEKIGLTRTEAAYFIGVSPKEFDDLVRVGDMPAPRRLLQKIERWDRLDVEKAFRSLPQAESNDPASPYLRVGIVDA